MDLQTIQALGVLINQIGLPATIGVLLVIVVWNLMPVVAEYLRAKISQAHATTRALNEPPPPGKQ